jgi:serine/threonine-protein kinase
MLFSFHCPSCKGKLEVDASLSGSQADCPQCGKAVAIPEARVDAGTTLAGFRLERRLGKGGMGEVYLATQLSVRRQVAVKVLPPGFAGNPEAVARFLHEGQLAARLDHANIVTVHEAGEDSGTFYLAMAYVEGESIDQRLKRDRLLAEAEALAIVRAMAEALAYAWDEFQLLHRDLKPANIMVDRRGRVFLMDLGLAKSLGEESGLTLSGSILGTPQYMSPEQAQGLADLGVPTDVYSLGATLYHLVTGSPPFTADSALKVLNQHVHEPLPPPRSRNPALSEGCSRLIERMMAKKPSERYGDWRALLADVDRVLAGAHPAVPLEPAVQTPGQREAPAVPPAVSKASLARQAQDALARQHQAEAVPSGPRVPSPGHSASTPAWRSPCGSRGRSYSLTFRRDRTGRKTQRIRLSPLAPSQDAGTPRREQSKSKSMRIGDGSSEVVRGRWTRARGHRPRFGERRRPRRAWGRVQPVRQDAEAAAG